MFESDDYDEILSQIELPQTSLALNLEVSNEPTKNKENEKNISNECLSTLENREDIVSVNKSGRVIEDSLPLNNLSAKHSKRKIINSHFNQKSKRKFPGPAGLLTGTLVETKDDSEGHLEVLSQDIDFTQNCLSHEIWESPLWKRLLEDTKSLGIINTIKSIKLQAVAGNLQKKKAEIVTAFIESVDRSAIDPLIIIKDDTDRIKCTLHRDAWNAFSSYIVSEYCALVLTKPTVLTTGSAFKKHYLNITLSNIWAIYSSALIDKDESLPEDCEKINEATFTIIKMERNGIEPNDSAINKENFELLDDLDNIFSDDIF
ncbi:unnamed protein product [Danaus chrysippus]|uniref:(African queen) hypothetical protein n=1 Tax=Danaus chrysippus TaxID=151541 RepID=A0A8J2W2L5_9NEOP|nr:unnamed protein product [Danaus chrysippus]